MKARLLLLGTAWVLLPAAGAYAQLVNVGPTVQGSSGAEAPLREVPSTQLFGNTLPIGVDNLVLLTQVGNSNLATLTQLGDANVAQVVVQGNGNSTTLTQQGDRNAANLRLSGNDNPVTTGQRGGDNQYNLDLTGTGTAVELQQNGNGNQVQSTLAGNGRQYSINQLGNNNELTQRETDATTLPKGYSVEMKGNGIRLTIEQGRGLVP